MNAPFAEVVFYDVRRALLVLHDLGSVLLLGAASHHFFTARKLSRARGGPDDLATVALTSNLRAHGKTVALVYAATFLLGAMLYPTYRVHVRAAYLDASSPSYAALFDLKEHVGAIGLFAALGLGLLSFARKLDASAALARAVLVASAAVCACAWFEAVAGVLVASVRGLG